MRIVVALDGSFLAEHALQAVAPLAAQPGNELLLVAVLNPNKVHETAAEWGHRVANEVDTARLAIRGAVAEPPRAMIEDRGQALEAARMEAENGMRDAVQRWLPEGFSVPVHVEWAEDPAEAIAKFAEAQKADLVAVGAHGRSGVKQVLVGSVTAGLVRRSPVPLIVVGESMRPLGAAPVKA